MEEAQLWLVRPVAGVTGTYELVEVGAGGGPLARCVVAGTAEGVAWLRDLTAAPAPDRPERLRRLLTDVADLLRADGMRAFRGVGPDGGPFDERL